MIRYIKLINYRSFTDITFDFTNKNTPNKIIMLYGANGAGKSNLVRVFETLYESTQTMNIQNAAMRLLEEDSSSAEQVRRLYVYSDTKKIITKNKTKGSDSNMVIEIGFQLNGKNGVYAIEYDDRKLVGEILEYTLEKNKGVYYSLSGDSVKINEKIFGNYKTELEDMVLRYRGKHTILSMLYSARESFSDNYFESMVSPSLINVMDYLKSIYVCVVSNNDTRGVISSERFLAPNRLHEGTVPLSDEHKIDYTEKILNSFFVSISQDISKVYYEKNYTENNVAYSMQFVRTISGRGCIIPYSEESCGIKNLMILLPYFLACEESHVVAIDEIDNGIHDVLLSFLLEKLCDCATGQLIITTHSLKLLNNYSFKDSFYFIDVDQSGNRKVATPAEAGYRIQRKSNVETNYEIGTFKSLPLVNTEFDFSELLELRNS